MDQTDFYKKLRLVLLSGVPLINLTLIQVLRNLIQHNGPIFLGRKWIIVSGTEMDRNFFRQLDNFRVEIHHKFF